jgi:hypothetical protein
VFRLSQDGAGGAAAFHRMCDNMGKTVREMRWLSFHTVLMAIPADCHYSG